MEVSGPIGIFANSSTHPDAVSYPVPPPTACRSMVKAIAYRPEVDVHIVAVGMCFELQQQDLTYNNRFGHNIKSDLVAKGNACQMHQSVLVAPRFQILGVLTNTKEVLPGERNKAHWMQSQFMKSLHTERRRKELFLGQREYFADFGLPKTVIVPQNIYIPVMHMDYLDAAGNILEDKLFRQAINVENGVCHYEKDFQIQTVNGILRFQEPRIQNYLDAWLGHDTWRRANKNKPPLPKKAA